jgi:anti-sigma regulatory factor (Ser/Thr protein kinase)
VSVEGSAVLATTELRIWKMLVSRYAATFAGTPEHVALARNHVWDYLADCAVADDACLIVSEFASNAVLHSLSRVGMFTVRCERFRTYVWVEVEDEGGDWHRPEPDGRPHGLDIVSLLVGDGGWGIEPTSEGQRIVWARLELPLGGAPSSRSPRRLCGRERQPRLTPTDL